MILLCRPMPPASFYHDMQASQHSCLKFLNLSLASLYVSAARLPQLLAAWHSGWQAITQVLPTIQPDGLLQRCGSTTFCSVTRA